MIIPFRGCPRTGGNLPVLHGNGVRHACLIYSGSGHDGKGKKKKKEPPSTPESCPRGAQIGPRHVKWGGSRSKTPPSRQLASPVVVPWLHLVMACLCVKSETGVSPKMKAWLGLISLFAIHLYTYGFIYDWVQELCSFHQACSTELTWAMEMQRPTPSPALVPRGSR